MNETAIRNSCVRCGECCLKSSPSLHQADIPLVQQGLIRRADLYTIRPGETVWDNILGIDRVTGEELLKVRERKGGKGCIYYLEDTKACAIYHHRPLQCSALACWDTRPFQQASMTPRAKREDILLDSTIVGLIREHEKRCGYFLLEGHVKEISSQGEKAVERIMDILRFDYHLRPFISRKLGIDPDEMDFIFGRPLTDTIRMFGLKVIQEADGGFLLTSLESGSAP